jgi:2-haloacid dehalogenase
LWQGGDYQEVNKMAGTPQIKALAFDIYGTLLDLDSLVPDCETAYPGHGREICQIWRTKQLEYTQLLSLIGKYEDFWIVTGRALMFACKSIGLECTAPIREKLLDRYFSLEPFPDVRPALQALSGYTLAALSNGSPKMLQVGLDHAGLTQFFAQVISTGEVQSYKPTPLVYQWALQKLGLSQEEVALVSANAWDLVGGKSLGLRVYWINRSGRPWDDLGYSPDATLEQLTELPEILAAPASDR